MEARRGAALLSLSLSHSGVCKSHGLGLCRERERGLAVDWPGPDPTIALKPILEAGGPFHS